MPTPAAKTNSASGPASAAANAFAPVDLSVAFDPTAMIRASQRLSVAAAESNAHLLESMRRMQAQWFHFLSGRLEHDMATARELAACRSVPDMWSVGLKFWERAAQQYAEEAEVVAGETAEAARESAADLRREMAVAAGDDGAAKAA